MEAFRFDLALKSQRVLVNASRNIYFKMFHQMFHRPFRWCHAKLRFIVLFIKTKIHLHESIYRAESSQPVRFQENPL